MRVSYRWMLGGTLLLAAATGLAAAAVHLWSAREPEWTTRSKAALEELESGLELYQRGYVQRAAHHFDRAIELDPRLVAAKIFLATTYSYPDLQYKELVAQIEDADPARLSDRERFLWRTFLAQEVDDGAAVAGEIERFLTDHPDDVFGHILRCDQAWSEQALDVAEECYYRLVELHPNYVNAYDRLGFIDMARGRFTEAEEHFRSYGFIAGDQARPYVSLAQLLVLLGRYDEAEETLETALRLDEQSCEAYRQLVRVHYFSGHIDRSHRALERMMEQRSCAALAVHGGYDCVAEVALAYFAGHFEESWQLFESECRTRGIEIDLLAHHAAIATGRSDEARRITDAVRRQMDDEGRNEWSATLLAHCEGVQRLAAGDYAEASRRFQNADDRLPYWSAWESGFKLLNRTFLARSLALEGRSSESEAMLRKVEAVNARFTEHLPDLSFLEP